MTIVPASSIKNCVVGEITEVAVKKQVYKGKVIALGKCIVGIVRIQLLCNGVTKHSHITFSTIQCENQVCSNSSTCIETKHTQKYYCM